MMSHLRTLAMISAFVLGYFCPWASRFSGAVRWFIVVMMFLVMLQVRFSLRSLRIQHLYLLLANLGVGLGAWGIFLLAGNRELAEAAFFTGITPTATAAPVIVNLLGERVDYAVSGFLVTNIGMALLFPFLIPLAIGNPAPTVFHDVIGSLLIVVGIPLAAAIPLRLCYRKCAEIPKKLKNFSFFLWVITIFLIIGNASAFLRSQQHLDTGILWRIALLSLLLCILNFSLGRFLAPRRYRRETRQVLGQKNTTLTIYLALTYANPLVALGPTFYVLWHNGWNTIQLHLYSRRERRRRR